MAEQAEMGLQGPKDLSQHWSRDAKSRIPSAMKQFYKYFAIPGISQLAGGLPNSWYFPYDTLEAKVALPDRWKPTPNNPVDPPPSSDSDTSAQTQAEAHLYVPHDADAPDQLRKIDLATALQYGTAQGYPPLYYFVRQFTRETLYPRFPYAGGPEVILTCGATDGFSKTLQLLTNEWSAERDHVKDRPGLLCEEFCYMNAIQSARPRGLNVIPVTIDDEGMQASGKGGLKDVLENWDSSKGKRPSLMYTVSVGQNPTSGVLSVPRRREIYKLCRQYDIIIVEDDPYWYLQYPSANPNKFAALHETSAEDPLSARPSTGFPFLDSLVPSYIALDVDGRVVRLDTFSKTVAPGCRLGWITAQPAFIERIQRITETSTQQPSGFVQSMIAELIMGPPGRPGDGEGKGRGGAWDGQGWKLEGWVRWLEGLRGNYERRMAKMCRTLDQGKEMVESGPGVPGAPDEWSIVEKVKIYDFDWPIGGMFIWLHANLQSHPLYRKVSPPRLSRALWVFWMTSPYKVLVSPGTIFAPTDEIRDSRAFEYFRLCFAAIDIDLLENVTNRFVAGFRAFWRIKDKKVIDELLQDDEQVFGLEQVMALQNGVPAEDLTGMAGPC